MTNTNRIALNTIVSYSRGLFALFMGLFSSRWILESLGQSDFGLYGVVGSIIVFITFLNGVTSGAVARFFAYSIGEGDSVETNKWFNVALLLHTLIPLGLLFFGWPLGEWAVAHWLNIPPERLQACLWVFRLSLLSALISMVSAPFIGMHTAMQKIAELSLWGLLSSCLLFGLAFSLRYVKADALVVYGAGAVFISSLFNLIQITRACYMFSECKLCLRYSFDKRRLREIGSYSGWIFFGALGSLFMGSSSSILLNKYFHPSLFPYVNASYSIANQVSAQTRSLSMSLMGALTPEITAAAGRGETQRMLNLSLRASKLSTFFILFFAVPLMIEMDYVLQLWLKDPPILASGFCSLMLASFVVDNLTVGQMVAVRAKGRIARYQFFVGGALIMTLPLAWGLLACGGKPVSVLWASLITMSFCSAGRVLFMRYLLCVRISKWIKGVFAPCICVVVVSWCIGSLTSFLFSGASLLRLVSVILSCSCSSAIIALVFLLDRSEKIFLKNIIKKSGAVLSREKSIGKK